jgi:hypothetical protein
VINLIDETYRKYCAIAEENHSAEFVEGMTFMADVMKRRLMEEGIE